MNIPRERAQAGRNGARIMRGCRSSGADNGRPAEPLKERAALPEGYGKTTAILLPRDPNWMFLYWEITPGAKALMAREYGPDIFKKSLQVLRVYDAEPAGESGPGYSDLPVELEAGSRYLRVQNGGRTYYCELGLVPPAGVFLVIVKSNAVTLPAARDAGTWADKGLAAREDLVERLRQTGGERTGTGDGDPQGRRLEALRALFSGGAPAGGNPAAQRAGKK